MQKNYTNIYKEARISAGMTILEASKLIGVSESTLKNYEKDIIKEKLKGAVKPADEIVINMIEIYGLDWRFGYEHLRYGSEIGQKLLPEFEEGCIERRVLKLKKKIRDVVKIKDEMIDIACDGHIDSHESETWEKIRSAVIKLGKACISLSLIKSIHKSNNKRAS